MAKARSGAQAAAGEAGAGREPMAEAAEIARLLRAVRKQVEQPQNAATRGTGLTMPQVSTLSVLFDRGPVSLKDLSRELGLSHSTVSGIGDRLELQGLARRSVDPTDRRVSLIEVTDQVDAYARKGYAESQAGRLVDALEAASPRQRTSILEALALLDSLLTGDSGQRQQD
jgi:MarR family transcriptional regulator, organic hydroperoxide resistance regulator